MEDYLNVNEKLKYEVIKKVVEGKKSKQRAECELGLSRRQINRYIQRFLLKVVLALNIKILVGNVPLPFHLK